MWITCCPATALGSWGDFYLDTTTCHGMPSLHTTLFFAFTFYSTLFIAYQDFSGGPAYPFTHGAKSIQALPFYPLRTFSTCAV